METPGVFPCAFHDPLPGLVDSQDGFRLFAVRMGRQGIKSRIFQPGAYLIAPFSGRRDFSLNLFPFAIRDADLRMVRIEQASGLFSGFIGGLSDIKQRNIDRGRNRFLQFPDLRNGQEGDCPLARFALRQFIEMLRMAVGQRQGIHQI